MTYWIGMIILLLGVMLGLQNPEVVTLHLAAWQWELPFSVAALFIFITGIFVGWLVSRIQTFFVRKK
jgi:uncharacterized integral membrane protein